MQLLFTQFILFASGKSKGNKLFFYFSFFSSAAIELCRSSAAFHKIASQTKSSQWSDMLTSSSTTAVKRRVVENFLVCQSSAVVAVDQCCKCPNGAVCRQFIDPSWKAVRFDGFLSCCFSHMLKFPPKKTQCVCQALIPNMLESCCFPRLVSPVPGEGEAINSGGWKCFQIRASRMPDLLSQSSALNNSGNRRTWGLVNYRDVKTVEHGKQIFSWWGYKHSRKHGKGCAWPNSVAYNLFMASPDRSRALKLGISVCMFAFKDGNGLTFVCL